MEGKNEGRLFMAVVVLAVLIVAGAGMLVFLKIGCGVPKLVQAEGRREEAMKAAAPDEAAAEATAAGGTFTLQAADFSITAGGVEVPSLGVSEEAEGTGDEGENEYLCSFSSERRMTDEDIAVLRQNSREVFPADKDIIQMVVNEIYARHGYQFTNPEIQAYFDQKQWYQEITVRDSDMDSIYQSMSDIEKDNLTLLMSYREG